MPHICTLCEKEFKNEFTLYSHQQTCTHDYVSIMKYKDEQIQRLTSLLKSVHDSYKPKLHTLERRISQLQNGDSDWIRNVDTIINEYKNNVSKQITEYKTQYEHRIQSIEEENHTLKTNNTQLKNILHTTESTNEKLIKENNEYKVSLARIQKRHEDELVKVRNELHERVVEHNKNISHMQHTFEKDISQLKLSLESQLLQKSKELLDTTSRMERERVNERGTLVSQYEHTLKQLKEEISKKELQLREQERKFERERNVSIVTLQKQNTLLSEDMNVYKLRVDELQRRLTEEETGHDIERRKLVKKHHDIEVSLKTEINEHQRELGTLKKILETNDHELTCIRESHSREVERLNTEIRTLHNKCTKFENTLRIQTDKYTQEKIGLENELSLRTKTSEKRIRELHSEIDQLSYMKKKYTDISKENEKLIIEQTHLRDTMVHLSEGQSHYERRKKELEMVIENLQTTLSKNEMDRKTYNTTIHSLQTELDENRNNTSVLQTKLDKVQVECSKLSCTNDLLTKKIEELRVELIGLRENNNELRKVNDRFAHTIHQMKSENKTLLNDLESERTTVKTIRDEKNQFKHSFSQEHLKQTHEIEIRDEKIQTLQNTVQELRNTITQLETTMKSTKTKYARQLLDVYRSKSVSR